jgi:release factor glutamine methyltransferase
MPITGASDLLGEAVLTEVRDGDRVLDMGSGSGVNPILAASKRAEVVAVAINPQAVIAARASARRHSVTVRVQQSDLFGRVNGRFYLIVFDPPSRWFSSAGQLRRCHERRELSEPFHVLSDRPTAPSRRWEDAGILQRFW